MKHTAPTFFDCQKQLDKIYQINNFLPKLNALIPWEIFRPILNKVRDKERLFNAGRKPFDVVLMFKILMSNHIKMSMHRMLIRQEEVVVGTAGVESGAVESSLPGGTCLWSDEGSLP